MRRGRTWPRLELDLVLDADAHNITTQSLRAHEVPAVDAEVPSADYPAWYL